MTKKLRIHLVKYPKRLGQTGRTFLARFKKHTDLRKKEVVMKVYPHHLSIYDKLVCVP
jgi:hypothetical protein